jgi:hypothetical protein
VSFLAATAAAAGVGVVVVGVRWEGPHALALLCALAFLLSRSRRDLAMDIWILFLELVDGEDGDSSKWHHRLSSFAGEADVRWHD